MSIIEAYPSIDKTFARRLGEANELRYARLQAKRDRAQAGRTDADSDDPSGEIVEETLPSQSQSRVSSDFTAPSTKFSSNFDGASFNSAKNPKLRAPASEPIFASSVLEDDSQKRSREIPKMPEDQPWGTPLSCTVSGDYLENVWSSVHWCKCISLLFDLPADLPVGGMFTRTCSLTSVLLQTTARVSGRSSQGVNGES